MALELPASTVAETLPGQSANKGYKGSSSSSHGGLVPKVTPRSRTATEESNTRLGEYCW